MANVQWHIILCMPGNFSCFCFQNIQNWFFKIKKSWETLWIVKQFVYRSGPKVIKLFSYSTQLRTKFILLINVKMPTIVRILNTKSERLKAQNVFICRYFSFQEQLKFGTSWVEHEIFALTLGPGQTFCRSWSGSKLFAKVISRKKSLLARKEIKIKSRKDKCQVLFFPKLKEDNGIARTLKKLRTSKGDYCLKQWYFTFLFKLGTSLKGKNWLPEGANSFL